MKSVRPRRASWLWLQECAASSGAGHCLQLVGLRPQMAARACGVALPPRQAATTWPCSRSLLPHRTNISVSISCASQITSGSLPRAAREGDTSARGEEPQLAGEVASSLHRSFRGSERVPVFQNTRCCSTCCREHLEIPALEEKVVKGSGKQLGTP